MIGAIAGDIIGSVYERKSIKTVEFPLFGSDSRYTDDTVLTVAVADAILSGKTFGSKIREYYKMYPNAGFGTSFMSWAKSNKNEGYGSFGNGSAMRVSSIGWAYDDYNETIKKAIESAECTHNHPEGIKGAKAVAGAIWLARHGECKEAIRLVIGKACDYDLHRKLDDIRPLYGFDVSCQGSVPEAIIAFLESDDYESAVRNAVSLGGDSDTQACIAGSIAEAYYGDIPSKIKDEVIKILKKSTLPFLEEDDNTLYDIVTEFTKRYINKQ